MRWPLHHGQYEVRSVWPCLERIGEIGIGMLFDRQREIEGVWQSISPYSLFFIEPFYRRARFIGNRSRKQPMP